MHFVKFSFALCLLVYCAVCTLGQTTKKPFLEDINENDPAAVEALRAGITKLIDGSEKKAEFYRNLTAVSAKRKVKLVSVKYIHLLCTYSTYRYSTNINFCKLCLILVLAP